MGSNAYHIDEATLRKFDKPGPRYTSYPTAVEFHPGVAAAEYQTKLKVANAAGDDTGLSLYTHLPFCEHRCLFCGCHVVISRREDVPTKYLEYLKREIEMVSSMLPNRRVVSQLHWGGGTPTHLSPEQLRDLYEHTSRHFDIGPGAEIAIEVDPRVTTPAHLETLADLGFNRLSLGVQDLTPEVQASIGRNQTLEQTEQLISHARSIGFTEGINVDLIYGLPKQTLSAFDANLDQILALRPDRVAVYSFAYVPWIRGNQRKLEPDDLPSPDLKLKLYLRAMEKFLDASYQPIGMDHFALPEDELARATRERRLHRNFMGYTVKPATDMIAFGISGIGDVQLGYFQNEKKLSTYYEALDADELPVARGYILDDDDAIRRYVITQLMCNFRVEKSKVKEIFGVDFDKYFEHALDSLHEPMDAGLVEISGERVSVTDSGRLFVRNVCMAFDRYLEDKGEQGPVFSRTV